MLRPLQKSWGEAPLLLILAPGKHLSVNVVSQATSNGQLRLRETLGCPMLSMSELLQGPLLCSAGSA